MIHLLKKLAGCPVEVVWHENKTAYIVVRKNRSGLHIRLHRLFQKAPTPVLEAIIDFALRKDKSAKAVIRQMTHLYFSKAPLAPKELSSKGLFYDLQEVFEKINKDLKLEGVSIGWSERSFHGKFRSMTFGCFDSTCRQIRINRCLDDGRVPRYFIEFIVYHEALHAVCPPKISENGRCLIHTREFREKEKQFPRFLEAKNWGKNSLQFFKKSSGYGRT
jgi:hypothetical protein